MIVYCETRHENPAFSPCPPFAWEEDADPEGPLDLFAAEAPRRVQRGCRECAGPARCAPWCPRVADPGVYPCQGPARCDDFSEASLEPCKSIFRPWWCKIRVEELCLWLFHSCEWGARARDFRVFLDGELAATCTLEAFLERFKGTLSPEEVSALRCLARRETYEGGGGASPGWSVLRIA